VTDPRNEPNPSSLNDKRRYPAYAFGLKEIPADFDDPLPPEIEAAFYDGAVEP